MDAVWAPTPAPGEPPPGASPLDPTLRRLGEAVGFLTIHRQLQP